MSIIAERTQRRTQVTGKGLIGTQVWYADWLDMDPPYLNPDLPTIGDVWYSAENVEAPLLRCVSASGEQMPENPSIGIWTAEFSTEGEVAEGYCETSLDISLEPGPVMTGYDYYDTGTPVVDELAPPIPVGVYTIKVRQVSPPYLVVMQNMNKTNDREFHGFPIGCVLFLGAGLDNSIDLDGNIIATAAVYKFAVKTREHKYFWRPPLQARDESGNLLYWHNIESEPLYYTTDAAKIATPVWINEVTGQEANPAGKGGWTSIEDPDGEPYFEEIDLADVLGIPGS
jgi:hypothetical protein